MHGDVNTEGQDAYENVFCNPAFELDDESEQNRGNYKIDIYCEPTTPPTAGAGALEECMAALKQRVCVRGALLVFLTLVLVLSMFLIALLLILKYGERTIEDLSPSDSRFGEMLLENCSWSPSSPHPTLIPTFPTLEKEPTFFTSCGGLLTGSAGSLNSPNHPGLYPAHSHCVWLIQVPKPFLVQIQISSLAIEGPSPCLFDWMEVQEESPKSSTVTRFCGNVAPPTLNTNSSSVRISFHSDGSIAGSGFMAQYHSISIAEKSCSREEFLCDAGRCLLPPSLCDGHRDCWDLSDEQDCPHKNQESGALDSSEALYVSPKPQLLFLYRECGGKLNGASGTLSSPNHPGPYPHQQSCMWQISVNDGHRIELSFLNFSLEVQEICEFDYVEVFNGADSAADSSLGRFCGAMLPTDLRSSGPVMSVLFVADDGVADSGFYASYRAISFAERSCSTAQFSCSSGECLHLDWVCDGWRDCSDGADEQNCSDSSYPSFGEIHSQTFNAPLMLAIPSRVLQRASSCEPIHVEMCRGLSYNLTSFPNIWLSLSDQREAASLLHKYSVLEELVCFDSLRRLVCGMFIPHCSPQGGVLQPCQSVCAAAEQQCSQSLSLLSFTWPFNCLLLPDSQHPSDCSLP
ncbi:hypothetical protein DNTS_016655 [Danionella cerebrum]|uniref:Membrane frizzled-related protein n=1 Tax=Danionella cerebrum TaxID=2873325 RepID=A0A553Q0C7_9TELE|nr:hypothetical protein DNTS_016655 [Danionella translucida]